MQLPQLLPPEKRPILCPNAKKRPRIQLLLQLENNRWKYCSECWSLHPHSMWRTLRSIWRLHQKPYCSSCHLLRGQSCYMPYAGEVDIVLEGLVEVDNAVEKGEYFCCKRRHIVHGPVMRVDYGQYIVQPSRMDQGPRHEWQVGDLRELSETSSN